MSRHELVPLDDTISCVVVGWERALGSYFFQMYRADNDSPFDAPDDELGCDFRQVTTAKAIIDEVRKYAHIPDALSGQLQTDMAREGMCEFPAAVRVMGAVTSDVNWDEVPIPF